ncbi:DUF167 family protein [Phyllobacterium myrsinacearum]|uniref:UPF0235 protein C5750_12710 n=1 Tax=Phyllobacterium myrsinacearum TaxID=28101 RepID=A0A2S9JKL0_9HYPH|nr:DUF167 family protein [Phyllobacterium myrsinacearum]PRD53617.1 hypothetical protein C5750_12710 [Phyllobacterium myrsinacearum]PWV93891.1 hypothetical protein DEV92_10363 [Phyllobacterium myrsinacearum]RZV07670.1 hypothetical protein EV654_2345 [Phyllobacterium myrsinacearum]
MRGVFFRKERNGVTLFVRLTPKSAKDAVEGVEATDDGRAHLKARVRAVPEDGKANAALEKLLAQWLGVAARDVSIGAGATSRLKQVKISGDPEALASKLARLGSPDE